MKLGIIYEKTTLSPGKIIKIPRLWHPKVDSWNSVYKNMLEKFNFHKYATPSFPINMGKIDISSIRKCPNVLRVPIKWGNSEEINIPNELLHLEDEICRILQYDYFVTGAIWKKMFCHLTIHNKIVESNTTQRFPGFHGDGLQGGKFKRKLICEHSYIAASPYPTVISLQPYFVSHLNEDRDNIFKAFDQQVKKDSLYHLRDGDLYLIDPYVVHASPIIPERTLRTFFRITTTPTELLMPKNTINPMFEGQIYPERIEVREFVAEPPIYIPHAYYGIDK